MSEGRIKLEEWVPNPLNTRQKTYVLRMSLGDRQEIHIFAAAFAAKKFLEASIPPGAGWGILDPKGRVMIVEGGLRVRCHEGLLHEVMNHEYTRREDLWDLPRPDIDYALRFALHVPVAYVPPSDGVAQRVRRGIRRALRQGMTTVNDLAAEFDITPREARAALRKRGEKKPEHGWAWVDGPELERIRDVIFPRGGR